MDFVAIMQSWPAGSDADKFIQTLLHHAVMSQGASAVASLHWWCDPQVRCKHNRITGRSYVKVRSAGTRGHGMPFTPAATLPTICPHALPSCVCLGFT